jgi:murein L,D-transpeptidase YcbB/YkuD
MEETVYVISSFATKDSRSSSSVVPSEVFKPGISAEMALRLQDAFGSKADGWMATQTARDLSVASRKKRVKVQALVLGRAA